MKKVRFVSALFLCMTAFTFTSCEVEPLDPAVLTEEPQNPTNPTNPGTPTDPTDTEPSSGDYWPSALNNSWEFDNGVTEYDMTMESINSINGYTYYTFNPQGGTSGGGVSATAITRLRKAGGNYYMKYDDVVVPAVGEVPGSTTTGSEIIILKDNVAVGTTWTKTYTQTTTFTTDIIPPVSMSVTMTGTIEEKDATITVNGQTYTNVIKAKLVNESSMSGMPAGTATSTYYFAKDVGPVKIEMSGSGTNQVSDLVSHTLN